VVDELITWPLRRALWFERAATMTVESIAVN